MLTGGLLSFIILQKTSFSLISSTKEPQDYFSLYIKFNDMFPLSALNVLKLSTAASMRSII